MPRTGTPPLAHGCQLTACLSLQRARVERRGFANGFRALESFRLAMIWRADRRGRIVCDANRNSPARPGRTPGDGEKFASAASTLAATRLARANRRDASGSPFWLRRPRGFATAKAQQYHAQACSFGVSDVPMASQSGHLRCVPCAKYPHCSAHSRDRTRQFASAPFTQLPLHRFRSSTAHSACANLTRPLSKLRLSRRPNLAAARLATANG